MSHNWKMGWKELKRSYMKTGYFVDVCKNCGVGRLSGLTTSYIPSDQVTKFLTTSHLPVDFYEYLSCQGKEDERRNTD